ncbi:MAG: hypothetical protein JST54_33320 [Deltaproteobacteria bacterium]|nr:hypothetical protein [Deltaproteobacteria bacterium]
MKDGRQSVVVVAPGEVREAVREILEGAAFRVGEAPDLAAAERLLPQIEPPAVLLVDEAHQDTLAPFIAALQRLRPLDAHLLPVVLMARVSLNLAGVREAVAKPLDPPLLVEVVQRLLEGL